MAQDAPSSIDMLDIQFKIHDRFVLFNTQEEPRSNVNLLAVSSSRGLLFAGNPHAAEFKVIIIKDLIEAKEKEKQPLGRLVPLPCAPNMLACSADGNLLAVNYTQNASGVLDIYSVQSCTSAQVIRPLHSIRLSPDEHVHAVQLLWNPVLPNSLAVVLSNGGLGMYALKDGGNFEFHSIDKSHQVKCGCWSPKGKQIVLGFPNGKLQQFKPDLTPAKTIVCPPNVHGVPFDTIALHWLSTYQFAVIFLQHGEDCTPSLYVINAPKAGTPSYINYYDICYSGNGPRNHQFNFTHVPQWNLLLVTSANGVEVGLLGTTETGDAPSWIQYTLLDEARIEMPLSESNDETFPMGFVYDTSSTHHLVISENKLPTMPMIHVLTTDGTLICLNFLNLRAGAASVCSPPPPIADTSGQFRALDTLLGNNAATGRNPTKTTADVHTTAADISFAFPTNAVTSTPAPAKDKPVSFFGASTATTTQTSTAPTQAFGSAVPNVPTAAPAKPAVGFGFGNNAPVSAPPTSAPFGALGTAPTFGNTATTPSFGGFGALGAGKTNAFSSFGNVNPVELKANPPATAVPAPVAVQKPIQSTAVSALTKPTEMSKPVYTIPPTYTPPTIQPISNQQVTKVTEGVDTVIQQIMTVQISAFNEEIEQLKQQTNAILSNIGNPNEIKSYTKRLNDLQEINEQANDHDFELDLQNLRHTLNESYAMLTECRTKLQIFKNPDMSRLMVTNNFNATSRRQLNRLKSYVAVNETQLQHIQQQIDMQWEHYQDVVRRSSDTKMRLPCLEGIYQRMTKLQNTLSEQRIKMNFIKTKLKEKGLLHDVEKTLKGDVVNSLNKTNSDSIVETLAESILSMTLSQTVDGNHSKLTTNKLQAIRQAVQQQKIRTIKPQRPDRVDLKSEVILETKLKSERQMREHQAAAAVAAQAAATVEKEQKAKAALSKLQAAPVTKPAHTASSLTKFVEPTPKSPEVNMPLGAGNTAPNFAFGKGNSFVKPIAATGAGMFAPEAIKTADTQSKTNKPAFGGFGTATGTSVGTSLSFGKTTSAISTTTTTAPVLSFGAAPLPSKPTTSGSKNLFAGIGNNLSITKVSTSQAATTPKETKTFEFTPTAQAGATNNNKNVTKTEEATVKPFQANTFFGSSLAPAVSGQPAAPSASASGSSLNFGGFGSALGLGTTSTFNFNAPVTASTGNTLTKSISGKNLFGDIGKPTADVTATNPSTASIFGSTTPSTSSSNTSETASEAPSVVSASSTVSVTSSTKPASTFSFGGTLPVSTDGGTASSTASVTTSISTESTSSFTFGGVTSTVSTTSATPTSVVSTSTTTAPMPSATDVVDKMLDSVTICKPTVKGSETAPAPAPAFGGFSVASSGASNFSFGTSTSAASDPFKSGLFASNTAATAPSTVAVTATVGSATAATTTTSATTVSATTATTALPSANSFSFTNALSNLSTGPAPTTEPAVVTSTAPVTTTTSTAPTIMTATTAVTATSTPSIFGSTTPTVSAFQTGVSAATGSVTTTTPSIFGSTATAASGSIFGPTAQASANTPSSAPSGNIFGGIPKPEQSVFGNSSPTVPATGLFASAAAANPSPFSSPTTAGGGSIFGGGSGVAATTVNPNPFGGGGGSIFGGATNTNTTSPFGGNSVFGGSGGAAVKSPNEAPTNIFGTPTNQTAAAPAAATGSIFGQSAFGQTANAGGSGGSLFGSTAAATSPAQQPTNAFGNTGSIFGGGASSAANSGGSIFGNASSNANAASAFGSNNFGSFSSPAGGGAFSAGGGAFAQGGASVAQSGFGSPQQQQSPQQQSNAFAKPVFGGAPTFGSPPPAFGASPTFGGAATFGNPKGFGSFTTGAPATNPVSPPAFGAPTQKNSLFETLGSTDSGLSFGNLAQSANVQKPAFGGSSFMNYRA